MLLRGRLLGAIVGFAVLIVITIVLALTAGGDEAAGKKQARPAPVVAPGQRVTAAKALMDVIGKRPGELGPMFEGLVFGAEMPADVKARVVRWEAKSGGHVRYELGDVEPRLEVLLADRLVVRKTLFLAWGKVDLDWGAWSDVAGRRMAILYDNGQSAGVIWQPYVTLDELLRPADPRRFGFEPVPLLGATLADVQAALGPRLQDVGQDRYEYVATGSGSPVVVRVQVVGGVITHVTADFDVHSAALGDQVAAILTAKWGAHPAKATVARSGSGGFKLELASD